jgi:hypothetical protein
VGKNELSYTVGGNVVNCITTMENTMEAPQKTKNGSAIQSSNSIPRDIPEGI